RPVLAFRPRLPRAEPPALAASPGAASLGQQSHENHGGDGHPSFAPLIQGKYSIEPWSDALAPRWEAVYEPQSPGCWPGPAVHVGMEWDSWFVGVAAAQWPPEKSPALRLEFSRRGW